MSVSAIVILFTTSGTTLHALSREDAVRVDLLYQRGTQLAEVDSLDAAARQFEDAIKLDGKHAPSYVGLGHVHLKSGNLKGAEKAFRQALRKRKNFAPALNGLGLVFRNTEKMLDWAIKYFRRAVRADRGYVEAYYNLAQTYREIGNSRELDTYKKLVKMDPDHHDVWFQIWSDLQRWKSGSISKCAKGRGSVPPATPGESSTFRGSDLSCTVVEERRTHG